MTTEEENKMTTRSSRESENHDKSTRQTHWTPRRQLEAPPDRPGFRYRWIRESMLGSEDRSNVSRRLREGFKLVRAEDLPEEWRDYMDCVDEGRHSGVIFNQGLLLAEIPENMVEERSAYYQGKTQDANDALDNTMFNETRGDNRYVKYDPERSTKVTFGKR